MCFQSSITDQFAFMQESWVNNEGFVQPGPPVTGPDPVIAQAAAGTATPQTWHPEYGNPSPTAPTVAFSFGQFVTLKGGEFFFAPSIPFLKGL
jgi:hypothetical protein